MSDKLYFSLKVFLIGLTFIVVSWNLSFAEDNSDVSLAVAKISGEIEEEFPPARAIKNYRVDPFTGTANFTLPLFVPSGRNGFQPKLNLIYSSRARNGILGVGWKLNLGYIERSTKNGVPGYDSADMFLFSLGEGENDLVHISGQEYRPEVSDATWKFTFDGQRWQAKDNLGNTYCFGLDNKLNDFSRTIAPGSPEKIFRWRLSKVTDTKGNDIIYQYLSDRINIFYAEKPETARSSYRKEDCNYLIQIEFFDERQDSLSNCRAGFEDNYPLNGSGRIDEVRVLYRNNLARRYEFNYEYSPVTQRSLLKKITEYNSDGETKNPPVTFSYSVPHSAQEDFLYNIAVSNFQLPDSDNLWNIRVADIGDLEESEIDYIGNDGRIYKDGRIYYKDNYSGDSPLLNWSDIYTESSGDISGLSWSIPPDGNLHISGKKGQVFHAWTYVFNLPEHRDAIKLPARHNCNGVYFVSDTSKPWLTSSGPRHFGHFNSFLLGRWESGMISWEDITFGVTRLDITGYNCDDDFTFDLNLDIAKKVDMMNSEEIIIVPFGPQLSGDFDGDGITDMGIFYKDGTCKVALSNRAGFLPPETWIERFGCSRWGFSWDDFNGVLFLGDFNGDGKIDLCAAEQCFEKWRVALSDGTKFVDKGIWLLKKGPNWSPGYCPIIPKLGDFNGDGLTDICFFREGRLTEPIDVAFSNGEEFILDSGFTFEDLQLDWYRSVSTGDFNADGITDFVFDEYEWSVYAVDIKGYNNSWPSTPWSIKRNFGSGFQFADYNGDGVQDVFYLDKNDLYLETFPRFPTQVPVKLHLKFDKSLSDDSTKLQIGDFNGDGLADFCAYTTLANMQIALSKGNLPDLLVKIENGLGAASEFKYRPSSDYNNTTPEGKPGLPFVVPVISEVLLSDGMDNTTKTSYTYSGGYYDVGAKEFRGFHYVSTRDDDGNVAETWFKQDEIYKGKIYKQCISDSNGNKFKEVQNLWGSFEAAVGSRIVHLAQTDDYSYDGDSKHRQTRVNYQYDSYGNLISMKNWGELAISGDEKEIVTEYVHNTADWLVSYPSHTYTLDDQGKKIQRKWLFYDGATDYTTPPIKGLLTKERAWCYNPAMQAEDMISAAYSYDSYGNLTRTVDPLGHTTTTEFDPDVHIYPVKVTNALGHQVKYSYDYKTGQALTTTDENNQSTRNVYDALGWLSKVIGPYDTDSHPKVQYIYDLSRTPIKITKIAKTGLVTYFFYDGLGRLIQIKSPAEDGPSGHPRQIVSDVVKFDFRGKIKEKYLPYFITNGGATSADVYTPPIYSGLSKFTFSYDTLGRLIKTTNPDSTYSMTSYLHGKVTKTDENGHQIVSYLDAYGRTEKIEEYNLSDVYQTKYKYDALNNLIKITDNQNNITSITYDSLGRKVKLNDPDMGIWRYSYDLAGNLLSQADGRGETITFEYDAFNRLIKKSSGSETLVSYIYDSGLYAIGRVSKVISPDCTIEFFYDRLGREIKTIKRVNGKSYTISRSYDALDRLTRLTYPDDSFIIYNYNKSGVVETVKDFSGYKYVKNIDYSPTGQITKIEYGNGAQTDYAYNPLTLRLRHLITTSTSGRLQDLSYTFDPAGNIKNIADRVNRATQDFAYDGLNRLTRAQGPYGSINYRYDSTGNIIQKGEINYTYGYKPHAVTASSNDEAFDYDANGNMIRKVKGELVEYLLSYDSENRLKKAEGTATAVEPNPEDSITLHLNSGFNFISLPFTPFNGLSDILSPISGLWEEVGWWDPVKKDYRLYVGDLDFDQFNRIEQGKGYWIYIKDPRGARLTLEGRASEVTQLSLKKGINAIGCPQNKELNIEDALSPLRLGVDYSKVYSYSGGTYKTYSSTEKEFTTLSPGKGYWIYMLKDTTWAIRKAQQPTGTYQVKTEFVYDGEGNRIKKITPQGTTTYINSLYEAHHVSNAPEDEVKHIFLGTTRICSVKSTGDIYYYHSDHLGSSNVLTDKDGKAKEVYEYKPYGEFLESPRLAFAGTSYYFTGKELDPSTGLYYYGARYYNPKLARFITPDPIIQDFYDPQSLNHYSYARSNPLYYTDPTGLAWDDWTDSYTYTGGWTTHTSGSSSWTIGWSSWSASSSTPWGTRNYGGYATWQTTDPFFQPYSFRDLNFGCNSLNSATITSMAIFQSWEMNTLGSTEWPGSGLGALGGIFAAGLQNPWTQTSISGINRGVAAYFGQQSNAVSRFAPGWTQGAARYTGFQSAFQGLGILQGSLGYVDIMDKVYAGNISAGQAYTAIGVHTVGMMTKAVGTAGFSFLGCWLTGGSTWGVVGGAVMGGTATSIVVNWSEERIFRFIGIQ